MNARKNKNSNSEEGSNCNRSRFDPSLGNALKSDTEFMLATQKKGEAYLQQQHPTEALGVNESGFSELNSFLSLVEDLNNPSVPYDFFTTQNVPVKDCMIEWILDDPSQSDLTVSYRTVVFPDFKEKFEEAVTDELVALAVVHCYPSPLMPEETNSYLLVQKGHNNVNFLSPGSKDTRQHYFYAEIFNQIFMRWYVIERVLSIPFARERYFGYSSGNSPFVGN